MLALASWKFEWWCNLKNMNFSNLLSVLFIVWGSDNIKTKLVNLLQFATTTGHQCWIVNYYLHCSAQMGLINATAKCMCKTCLDSTHNMCFWYHCTLFLSLNSFFFIVEEQSKNVRMNWKWKGKKCLGLCSHSTHGYRLMTTGPQRLNGIPRRCMLRTLLASRVSLPDNTYMYSPSCSHTCSFRKKCWRERRREPGLLGLSLLVAVTADILDFSW